MAALLLPACEKIDRNMWDNPAFKPQEEPVRLPPRDSIPTKGRERIPSMAEAASLKNPVSPTEGNLSKGKELFGIFCVPCHGDSGKGDGPVGKKYVPTPADLGPSGHGAHHPDGTLFVVISNGAGGMPSFRADLAPVERWQIVAYLRTLK
ncbi:MAG: menaquinol oxidoreductase [Deltaproteobacteria bacterium]|nr:MAG: menaquinol oxidoreductase [Deltaproteobacteria bacterium]